MRLYPKLMCLKADPDSCVVYFANPNSGMVVHSTVSGFPVGTIHHRWENSLFEDVSEDVVIWLTEGPVEPIHEAIEMVEKVKALHVADTRIGWGEDGTPKTDDAGYDVFS